MQLKAYSGDEPLPSLLFEDTVPIAKLAVSFIKVMPSLGW